MRDQYYHVYNRSIAKYVVFNNSFEYRRMYELIKLLRFANFCYKYSRFIDMEPTTRAMIIKDLKEENDLLVEIVAFCLMPTHIHLLLKQVANVGITKFMGRVLNGYTKFFNTLHSRYGPLWSGRFKSVLVKNDVQFIHLTRYIHLNPSSSDLVSDPVNWQFSSYKEYIDPMHVAEPICRYENLFNTTPIQYKKFTDDQKDYQHNLHLIKNIIIDN